VIFALIFGAASAAFLPTAARRLAVRYGAPPLDACPHCQKLYHAWVRVGPACRCERTSWWIVAVGSATAAMLAAAIGPSPLLPVYLLATIPALLLAVIDLRCLRLPDRLVGALALAGVVPSAVLRPHLVWPALLAGGAVLTAYGTLALLPGNGLGLGDVKLAAVLALILGFAGWPAVIVGVVAPHLINGPIAIALLARGRRTPLAFGPALLAGALIAVTAT
jgi:leader peptidase (prepilin peptidase)/N-methyltransferase